MRQSETCAISPPSGDANAPAQLLAEKFAAFLRQIGSPDVFPETLPFGLPRGGIGGERELCDFLTGYLNEVLAPWEMPAIAQAHRHAERGHIRELIALDRQLNGWPIWPDPASASRRIGREQLERLRPLRDERTVRRYLAAVEAGRASGWHTVVYGLSLAVYSWPLRHGLLTYARETLTGLACAAARAVLAFPRQFAGKSCENCFPACPPQWNEPWIQMVWFLTMRYAPIDQELFRLNRANLKKLLPPHALAVVNANDVPPVNGDAVLALRQNSDLFYLTGIEQEESLLLLYPDAHDPKHREILFLRQPNPLLETWEGHKLSMEEARGISGVERVEWLSDFAPLFHRLMCECSQVWLNSNEHTRASVVVESRDARFIKQARERYPLHDYQRLARLMRRLRAVKSDREIALMRQACDLTEAGFRRVCRFVKPGVNEMEVEAEFAHEFLRRGGQFAYSPIIASGRNACALHYLQNDQPCRQGELLLLDVAASYANYNSDMTRTIPVSGRFSRRQRQVYNAVLRVLRAASRAAVPGKLPGDWQKEAEGMVEKELVSLGLLTKAKIEKQNPSEPAVKRYFMHGIGHPLGLDVHDLAPMVEPIQAGWVLTVEPGIYIPDEGFGVRLENNILIQKDGNVDLMANIPIEAEEVERLMRPSTVRK